MIKFLKYLLNIPELALFYIFVVIQLLYLLKYFDVIRIKFFILIALIKTVFCKLFTARQIDAKNAHPRPGLTVVIPF